jgi:hypothetical protein
VTPLQWMFVSELDNANYEVAEPHAGALIESLRAFGYSPEAAIADLVDNSISAGATDVDIRFEWQGVNSVIAIADNGYGMSEATLATAMRLGASNPLDPRSASDLGRFGLGLKTASLSQCRRLVVISAPTGSPPSTRTWDLDYVGRTAEWRLLQDFEPEDVQEWQNHCPTGVGTVVLWRKLDRLVDPANPEGVRTESHFYQIADQVRDYLRVIFHRFMRGPGAISIRVGGRVLTPWDPFFLSHPATQPLGDEHLIYRGLRIRVRSYVLPHASRLTPTEARSAGGPHGWAAQQGFYVYRSRRLIVAGGWLGLGFGRDEPTRLARIQLDLPNSMDEDWQVDVRKSSARPPAALTEQLRRIAEVARRSATQIYRHRGKVLERSSTGPLVFAWEQLTRQGQIVYRINRDHPVVAALLEFPDTRDRGEALLRVIEETVPIPLVVLDHMSGDSRQASPFEGAEPDELRQVITSVARALKDTGLSDQEVAGRLLRMEPFSDYPLVVAELTGQDIS